MFTSGDTARGSGTAGGANLVGDVDQCLNVDLGKLS
jgi:hypothetical protein